MVRVVAYGAARTVSLNQTARGDVTMQVKARLKLVELSTAALSSCPMRSCSAKLPFLQKDLPPSFEASCRTSLQTALHRQPFCSCAFQQDDTDATMSGASLAPYVLRRPWLKRWMTPLASWYADASGYRRLGTIQTKRRTCRRRADLPKVSVQTT
jgi:hypothetical protein